MENKKQQFAFIIAVTNEQYFNECMYYIKRLFIPDGYDIDILAIRNAETMCSAYNKAMYSSQAKYKIYLHQDVFIRNLYFLYDILHIFEDDKSIGMIGMLGGTHMPKSGMAFCSWNEGVVAAINPDMAYLMYGSDEMVENTVVEAVDGLLIATQYDVPWREDLFKDFDFYDVSQSFEMRKAGYTVIVPVQDEPWTIHDSSLVKLKNYNKNRKICLKEYAEFFYAENGKDYSYNEEWDMLCEELGKKVINLINEGEWEAVRDIILAYRKFAAKDTLLETCGIISDIYWEEERSNRKNNFFSGLSNYIEVYSKYTKMRFLLRRIEMALPETEYTDLLNDIRQKKISCNSIIIFIIHSILDKKKVLLRLADYYQKIDFIDEAVYVRKVYEMIKEKKIPVAYTFTNSEK